MGKDILEAFIKDSGLTINNTRDLIDDYSLISYYLDFEYDLNTRYSSPLREGDDNPSFSLFYGYGKGDSNKLYFKDMALDVFGDVYDFLKIYLDAKTPLEVLQQVNMDLDLGLDGIIGSNLKPTIIKKRPVTKERPFIEFVNVEPTKAFMDYWYKKYGITHKITELYNVSCVKNIHFVYANKTSIQTPQTLCIGYTIGKYCKIYLPFESKDKKFRNNYPNNYVEGYEQLDWSKNDLLVITKSTKECMLFRQHWNIQAVSGKSETTFIPNFIMEKLVKHFKRIIVWLDPDETGLRSTEKYLSLYPTLIKAILPKVKEKDPTDIFEAYKKTITTYIVMRSLAI